MADILSAGIRVEDFLECRMRYDHYVATGVPKSHVTERAESAGSSSSSSQVLSKQV